jgi:hypothetical protein
VLVDHGLDHAAFAFDDAAEVGAHLGDGEAEFAVAARLLEQLGAGDHRLCRDASDVDAAPSDLPDLDERHLVACGAELHRQRLACLPAAEDDVVEPLDINHVDLRSPRRSIVTSEPVRVNSVISC